MSRPRTDLSIDVADVKLYVKFLASIAFVDAIYVNGSRSPNSVRKAREDSDWDFICVVSSKSPIRMKGPRDTHGIHADTIYIQSNQVPHYTQAVMIWPEDAQGVLSHG